MNIEAVRKAALVVARMESSEREAVLERMPLEHVVEIRAQLEQLEMHAVGNLNEIAQRQSLNLDRSVERERIKSDSLRDLLKHEDRSIARVLACERSTIVAAVLCSLPRDRAGGILRQLPVDERRRAIAIWDAGVKPNLKVVDVIAEWICDHLAEAHVEPTVRDEQQDALQAILDEFSAEERTELLESLADENPLLARRLVKAELQRSQQHQHEWSC